MTPDAEGTLRRVPTVSPTRRRLAATVTAVLATLLTVLSWPVGPVVAGLFGVVLGVSCRHWSPPARVAVGLVGACVAVTSAVVMADFSSGTSSVTSGA